MNKYVVLLGCLWGISIHAKSDAQIAHVTYFAPAPACAAPVQVTSFFAPTPVVAYQPVAVAQTRFRPFLGGTVTRFRTAYVPTVVAPAPVMIGF